MGRVLILSRRWLVMMLLSTSLAFTIASALKTPHRHSELTVAAHDSARIILQRYADAWRGQQELQIGKELVLVFWIRGEGGGDFHLLLSEKKGGTVLEGVPDEFDVGFELDIGLLRQLDQNQINALTAMGKSSDRDTAPMTWKRSSRFDARPNAELLFRRLGFHFWTRDYPETVRFGGDFAREIHGANAVLLLYDDRFRSAWYQLKAGMHVFPGGQKAPFTIMLICTRGHLHAKFNGDSRVITEGEAVFIPAGMSAEYWAEANEYGEAIWMALGDGA